MRADREVLQEYLAMDEEELLEELGESLLGTGPGFSPSDFERSIRFAQAWLGDRREELRRQVCGEVWPKLEKGGGFDAMTDAAAVADSLRALLGKPTAFIVAVILVRRGLGQLCSPGNH